MTPTDFQLAIISAAVLVNLPVLGFLALGMWRMDVRLARVETKLEVRVDDGK